MKIPKKKKRRISGAAGTGVAGTATTTLKRCPEISQKRFFTGSQPTTISARTRSGDTALCEIPKQRGVKQDTSVVDSLWIGNIMAIQVALTLPGEFSTAGANDDTGNQALPE